ncbi:MAG: M48 family metallopeptidase [Bellilinea sp.]
MNQVEMSQAPVIDRIIRSRRKTVALIVTPEGKLEVRAPLVLGRKQIETIVSEKSGWIKKQQERVHKSNGNALRRPLSNGVNLWFLGASYPLKLTAKAGTRVAFSNGFSLPESALPKAAELLTAWYKARAREIISERVRLYADKSGLKVKSIRITSARTRWGSCSRDNALSFTWRLVMAPIEIIDYIVVHELAHIIEKNHSRAFWNQVEKMQPDYKARRKWLKGNGRLFDLAIEANEANLKSFH